MLKEPVIKATVPESIGGFDIVMWSHENDDEATIMCYPEAKATCSSYFGPQRGEAFCLPLNVGTKGMEIFNKLVAGDVELFDLWKYFHEPIKHGFALGWLPTDEATKENYEMWEEGRKLK